MKRLLSLVAAVASVALLASCSPSIYFGLNDGHLSRDRMANIVEAVNNQDAAALRNMFSKNVLAEYSEEIDTGVAYLLSLFPDGDVIWRDPGGGDPHTVGTVGYGLVWVPTSFDVTSGGEVYSLYFANTELDTADPDNVGIYAMGAVIQTESGDSGLEAAYVSWVRSIDWDGGPPGVFIPDSSHASDDRMTQIIDALNAHDAAALRDMFTRSALADHSALIDDGLSDLLSFFSGGDIAWQSELGGSSVDERIMGDTKAVLLSSFYRVTSGGVEYQFFFADFTENTIDPDNLGIYAMGAVPTGDGDNYAQEAQMYDWSGSFDAETTNPPEILVPLEYKAESQMEQIAAALNSHDAEALEDMFSTAALEQTPEIDEGVDYLFSLFPNGGITWTEDPAAVTPVGFSRFVKSGNLSEWLFCHYKLSANGNEYWLYFDGATIDELNPDRVGLNKLGVTPWVEERDTGAMSGPSEEFDAWVHENGNPGIYVPD